MRCREFVRNFRRTSLQVSLSSFSSSFLPIVDLGLKFFQMRRSRVDLFEQLTRLSIACENGQRSDVGFLSCEHFKLVVLVRRFLFRPGTRRVARDCFNLRRSASTEMRTASPGSGARPFTSAAR